MPWKSLRQRLPDLPLILAGPLLRRTEPGAVTVWLALRYACQVTLNIYPTVDGEGWLIAGNEPDRSPLLQGNHATVAIGQHLHLVAVTAYPTTAQLLQAGQIYAYDLQFRSIGSGEFGQHPAASHSTEINATENSIGIHATPEQTWTLQTALNASGTSAADSISYFDHQLPTFCLPPDNLNHLQIVHGSCRKLHGSGKDALAILDGLIAQHCTQANHRPHQLFLTGDQIYGDDVADPLLLALTDAGNTLLGWEEQLPLDAAPTSELTTMRSQDAKPGQRSPLVTMQAGLTASLYNQPERAKSHLLSFGEYCAIYLFAWSPVLWGEFPRGETVWTTSKPMLSRRASNWNAEVKNLEQALRSLPQVRRALANIPTYMICDDHDISDDWYLNRNWCSRVFSRALGRRIVQNGLLSYALFQAWGNTPAQFASGRSGAALLQATNRWSASAGTALDQEKLIARYLGLPALNQQGEPKFYQDGNVLILDRHPEALEWHYVVRSERHEVIVLDTRTWRGYPLDSFTKAPAMLLSPTAFDRQLHQVLTQTNQLKQTNKSKVIATLIVAPTNLVSLRTIDRIQQWQLNQGKVFDNDVGDAWNIHKDAFAKLLQTLFDHRDRVIVLSGDIHYGSTVCLHYWSRQDELGSVKPHVLAQLTSSALKNVEWKTRIIHTRLKSLWPERSQDWVGWNEPLQVKELNAVRRKRSFVSPPDWGYHVDWMQRHPAQTVWVRQSPLSQGLNGLKQWGDRLLTLLWNNHWMQEGSEVVGLSNLGRVQFEQFEQPDHPHVKAVIHDLYWYAPWHPHMVVCTRFYAPLSLTSPERVINDVLHQFD